MKTILFIILCIPFARKEKVGRISTIRFNPNGHPIIPLDKHPNAMDTVWNIIIPKFMPDGWTNPTTTQCQYFTIGRFVAIRRKNELEISWD